MIKNVYFLGIGGIGMSALARYYHHAGAFVAGYDLTQTHLTDLLQKEGMDIHFEDDPERIPEQVIRDKAHTLVIYTPALPPNHKEHSWLGTNGYDIIKRSAALGRIAEKHTTLAVAGTHGKTTTSTLLAHILQHAGTGCTAFLGGISRNYNSNLLLSKGRFLVAEADEYDRSFLQLHPQFAVITSAEADHLDIYGTHQAVKEAFAEFASQVVPGGSLVIKKGITLPLHLQRDVTLYTYDYKQECDFYTCNARPGPGGKYTFDLVLKGNVLQDCRLGIPGRIHVENAVAAAALAFLAGIKPTAIREALATFCGVTRRMDVRYHTEGCCYIDDYAHHPAEIRATVLSVREWFPNKKITGIFQPHLYSRTRDFAREFAKSLDLLDRVVLLPVYPARETPIPGVDSEMLAALLTTKDCYVLEPAEVVRFVRETRPQVLLTLGAGNIDRLVDPITTCLKEIGL